jgi:hypothetical protein
MISRTRLVLCDTEPTWPLGVRSLERSSDPTLPSSGSGARSSNTYLGLASSGSLDELLCEFPSVELTLTRDGQTSRGDVVVDGRDWRSPACNPREFDELVASRLEHGARTLDVRGRPDVAPRDALEVLTRYQRFVGRRNAASRSSTFDRALELYRAMHDPGKPLARADLDHGLDTWQWALRLDPNAPVATQLAALYKGGPFDPPHGRGDADTTRAVLREASVEPDIREEVGWLVAHQGDGRTASLDEGRTIALATLTDADALSFFSLGSPGFVDHFGLDHAHRMVGHALHRMSHAARVRLSRIRLRADVARILAEALT